jgi:hypothetical protein
MRRMGMCCTLVALATVLGPTTAASAKPAFRKVPFSLLIRHQSTGVYTTSTVSFPYVLTRNGINLTTEGQQAPVIPLLSVARNHCKAVHVEYIFGNEGATESTYAPLSSTKGTLSVVQQRRAPTVATTAFDSLGSVDAKLVPGQTWSITVSAVKPAGNPAGDVEVFVNGFAICSSAEKF